MATDAAAKEAGRLPQLVASGQWLTTKDGEVAILRGVNLVSKTSKTPEELGFDERSAQLLQDRGFSVVRLGVLWCNVEPYLKPDGKNNEYDLEYLASLKRTIELLAPRHQHAGRLPPGRLLSPVGLRSSLWALTCPAGVALPGGGAIYQRVGFPNVTFGLGANAGTKATETDCDAALDAFWGVGPTPTLSVQTWLWEQYGDMIQFVAWFFHDRKGDILGYDPLNEPTVVCPGSRRSHRGELGAQPPNFTVGCKTFDETLLQPFYQSVITRLRKAHPEAIVWLSRTGCLVSAHRPISSSPIFRMSVSTSTTTTAQLTKLRSPTARGFREHTTFHYCAANMERQPFQTLSQRSRPSTTSRCSRPSTGLISTTHVSCSQRRPANCHLDPRSQGIVRNMAGSLKDPLNVNFDILEALTRVYPRIIAGTPGSFSYNPGTQVFNLTYSTQMVAGSAPRSVTSIVVPACLYPSGYTPSVTNGTWKKTSEGLEVTASQSPGGSTTTVTVTISPA